MRTTTAIGAMLVASLSQGQVELGTAVHFSGPAETRKLMGLATPTTDSSAITVAVAASGIVHWAVAGSTSDTLRLAMDPDVSGYRIGLLVRFIPNAENPGKVWIDVDGLGAFPVLGNDGRELEKGALRVGSVAELLFAGGSWILMNLSHATCPPGSLPINARVCMDVEARPGTLFYQATERCGERGGKLCTWDEYVAGCTMLQTQLTGLFDEWEWIDDCSNHTHSADQVGRFTCQSQRAANVITVMTADARCCYHPR